MNLDHPNTLHAEAIRITQNPRHDQQIGMIWGFPPFPSSVQNDPYVYYEDAILAVLPESRSLSRRLDSAATPF